MGKKKIIRVFFSSSMLCIAGGYAFYQQIYREPTPSSPIAGQTIISEKKPPLLSEQVLSNCDDLQALYQRQLAELKNELRLEKENVSELKLALAELNTSNFGKDKQTATLTNENVSGESAPFNHTQKANPQSIFVNSAIESSLFLAETDADELREEDAASNEHDYLAQKLEQWKQEIYPTTEEKIHSQAQSISDELQYSSGFNQGEAELVRFVLYSTLNRIAETMAQAESPEQILGLDKEIEEIQQNSVSLLAESLPADKFEQLQQLSIDKDHH
jgi:hypothetical protein